MACLAFRRSPPHSQPALDEGLGPAAPDGAGLPGCEWQLCQLSLADEPTRIASEGAVFESLAQQVTAFICNVDEATVNVGAAMVIAGAAEPQASCRHSRSSSICGAGSSCGAGSEGASPRSCCAESTQSGSSLARSGSGRASIGSAASSSGGSSSSGSARSSGTGPALFRRLSAARGNTGGLGGRPADRRAGRRVGQWSAGRVARQKSRYLRERATKQLLHNCWASAA